MSILLRVACEWAKVKVKMNVTESQIGRVMKSGLREGRIKVTRS